jgi:hypothetical protein
VEVIIISRAGGLCLCGFHACDEEFEKFCAVVAYRSEDLVTINEFGIAQKLS